MALSSLWSTGFERLLRWRRKIVSRLQGQALMLGLAAFVGAGTGLLAAALISLIASVQGLAWGSDASWTRLLIVPTLGAFLVGLAITYLVPESSGSGIVQTMRTISLRGGRFRGRVPLGGVLASGLAIGTGASGGREGPIVLIGGSLASLVGRVFALDDDRVRTLVAAGAAAGIGASFNAPIGGMLFATELLIGGFRPRSLQTVVVASVAGSVTARQVIGPGIIYQPSQTYVVSDPRELALYAVLGIAAALVGLGFLYGEDLAKKAFGRLRVWRPARVALGGFGLGIVALVVPEVLGTGDNLPPIDGFRDPIHSMVNGEIGVGYAAAGFLLVLGVAKLVATSVSIGSGNAIGTFAPVIFTGAAIGGAVGHVAQELLPTATPVLPGAFALVGMAAAFGAAARAPLTAIVIVFELTGDYELVLPLMLATGLATFLADRVTPHSVYTLPLYEQGIVYAEPDDVDIMQTVYVGEIMTKAPDVVPRDLTVERLRSAFHETGHHGFPVVEDGDRLVGVVTLADLDQVDGSGPRPDPDGARTVGDICTRYPTTVVPNDPVYRALRRMAALDVGRLPVVAPDDHRRLVGLIRRADLVRAYQHAVARTVSGQQRRDVSKVRDLVGVRFMELAVGAGAAAAGRRVQDIDWPASTVLTSVRRRGEVIVPQGDTELRAGDEIVALAPDEAVEELQELCSIEAAGSSAAGG